MYGISFWVVLINCLILALFYNRLNIIKIIFVFFSPFLLGFLLYSRLDVYIDESIKASLIQPNVNLFDKSNAGYAKKNLDNLIEKSNLSLLDGSNLVIWPESAIPFYNLQNPITLEYISKKVESDSNIFLLSGDITYFDDKIFNSSVLVDNGVISTVYHKQRLVPMGEYVPLSYYFKKFQEINFGQTNFEAGVNDVIFEAGDHKFSSLICFESTFPEINRRHAKKGAQFFVYLVNDGWYTTIPEPRQHAKQSIFRAIENRRSILRCANTGISMIISPLGIVEQQTSLNKEDVITTFITKTNTITFYTKYGNIFVYLMLLITMILFFYSVYKNENNS
jgi:apolipoprotein N-acyltransferase